MNQKEFVDELRIRQLELGMVPQGVITTLSDDEIIEAYRICSSCGEPIFEPIDLDNALKHAKSADGALEIAESFYRARRLAKAGLEQFRKKKARRARQASNPVNANLD